MASVTHQALLMIGGAAATAPPGGGWQRPLSTVAASVNIQPRVDAASYRNGWLFPPTAVVTVVKFGWSQPLSVAPIAANAIRADDGSYQGNWKAGLDPSYSAVVLLMGFEGADASTGAPGLTDESARHGTASVIADAQIDTAQFKFGVSSLLLDGTGDNIRFADSDDWNLAAGSFTIECWIRPHTVAAGTRFIVGQWEAAPNLGWVLYQFAGQLWFNVSVTGSNSFSDVGSATLLSADTWYAVAIDFNGSKYRLYLDGVMVASSTTLRTIHDSNLVLSIGGSALSSFLFNGWIDELRITKGVARYASDGGYTVPTAAFPRS